MHTGEKMRTVLFLIAAATAVSTALIIRNEHRLKKKIGRQAPVIASPITSPTTDCVCVAFNLCSANYTLNKFGVPVIDIRQKEFSPCGHYLDVCCREKDVILKLTPSTIEPSSSSAYNALPNSTSSSFISITPTSTETPTPTNNASPISPSIDISSPKPLPEINNGLPFILSTSNILLSMLPTINDSASNLPVSNGPPSSNILSSSSPSYSSPLPSSPNTDTPLFISTNSSSLSPNSPTTNISLTSSLFSNMSVPIPSPNNPSPSPPRTDVPPHNSSTSDTSPLSTILTTDPLPNTPSTSSPFSNVPLTSTSFPLSTSNNSTSPKPSTPSILKPISPFKNIPLIIATSPNNQLPSSSTTDIPSFNSPTTETNQLSNVQTANTLLSKTPATNIPPSNAPTTDFSSSNAPTTQTLLSNTSATNTPSSNAPSTSFPSSNTPTTSFPSSSSNPLTTDTPLSNTPTTNIPLPSVSSSNVPLPISQTMVSPSSILSVTNDNSSLNEIPLTEDPDTPVIPPRAVTKDTYVSRGCGFSNDYGLGFRIIGGKYETQFAEFPWVVAILRDSEKFVCGGSLIHPKVVLTSAHCVRGAAMEKLVARAGEWDRGTTKEILPHQDRKIDEIVEHEYFHSGALLNDVALLILKEPMKLCDNVDVICLPTQDFEFDETECVASGWGKDNFNSTSYQMIMKKVYLPLIKRDTCQTMLRKTRLGAIFELHESFICAGGKKDQDTCKGDGGGPLMCPLRENPSRYQQAGIVAWGIGCGDSSPGVYAKVSQFRSWIDSQLKKRGIAL